MSDNASRRGATGIAPLLMIVSFLAIGGFLFWLSATAEGTQPAIDEEPEVVVDPIELGAMDVSTDQLRTATATYEGELLRLTDVGVLQAVGSQAFYFEVGVGGQQSSPFLAKIGSDLLAQGQGVPSGQIIMVGRLLTMNDSIVSDWASSGAIGDGERPLVEFSTHFLEALVIR